MSKYRIGRDDAPERKDDEPVIPGHIPDGRLGVYDARGRLRGQVGKLATSVTARRFGLRNPVLGQVDGRPAWRDQTLAEVSSEFKSASPAGTNPQIAKPKIGGPR
jgi:hypothetical protein